MAGKLHVQQTRQAMFQIQKLLEIFPLHLCQVALTVDYSIPQIHYGSEVLDRAVACNCHAEPIFQPVEARVPALKDIIVKGFVERVRELFCLTPLAEIRLLRTRSK